MLSSLKEGKIIPRAFSKIQHLPGSKMIDSQDKLIGSEQAAWMTERRRTPKDLVIITEKVDGANCAILRQGDELVPLLRAGYDCRTNPCKWLQDFAEYVETHANRFFQLLTEGERICGEWMIKTHTLNYKLPHEPFIAFDLISGSNRTRYIEFRQRALEAGITIAGLLHMGEAMPVTVAMELLGSGYHGVIGEPEGVIYRYEDHTHGFICCGKYVSNPLLGNDELFRANEHLFNKWKCPRTSKW